MKRFLGTALIVTALIGCASPPHFCRRENGQATLYLRQPDAKDVQLVASSEGFRPRPAQKTTAGLWAASVSGSEEFTYFYLVDGKMLLPPCDQREADDFGGSNCLFVPVK